MRSFFFFSELDEEECERRRTDCLYDMQDLERQFSEIKEQYVFQTLDLGDDVKSLGKFAILSLFKIA